MIKHKTIFFDFDGVILDSFTPAHYVSSLIHPNITEEQYRQFFEGNVNDTHHRAHQCNENCKKDFDFFGVYVPKIKETGQIFEGIHALIHQLSQKYRLAIISSTITEPIRELLSKFDLHHHFEDVLGNDVHKSKVEKIKMLLSKYEVSSDDCLFVTDTLGDLREAEIMGVKKVAVSWGFHSKETLQKGSPLIIADSPMELGEWLAVNF